MRACSRAANSSAIFFGSGFSNTFFLRTSTLTLLDLPEEPVTRAVLVVLDLRLIRRFSF